MPGENEVCRHHEALCQRIDGMVETQQKLNGTMQRVDKALGKGEVDFSNLKTRLTFVEKIVYGAVGLILTGFVVAVIALVVR